MATHHTFEVTQGDRQRLPSSDTSEWITLLDPSTDEPLDLTGRTVEFTLSTRSSGGDRLDLTNDVEVHSDPTTGQVSITLEPEDTSIDIRGSREELYGEFRVSGGGDDPTTTPLPSTSIRITVHRSRSGIETSAETLTYFSDVDDVDNIHNTVFVDVGESIVDAVDRVESEYGSGTVYLLPGTHETPHVELPSGVVLEGASPNDEAGSTTTMVPEGDHHVVSCLGNSDGMAQVRGLHIDTTGIGGYSSDALRILSGANTGGTRQVPWVENVSIEGTPAEGNGIHFHDINEVGISWVSVRDSRVLGFNNSVAKTANGSGWVNGTSLNNVWLRHGTTLINETGTVNLNRYDVKVQVSDETEDIIRSAGPYTLEIHSFDSHNSPSSRLIQVRDVGSVSKNQIIAYGGERMIRSAIYGGGVRRTEIQPESEYSWLPATPSPNWLIEDGTGQLTHSNFTGTLATGSSAGDAYRLSDGGNRIFFLNRHADPWLQFTPNLPDTTDLIVRAGWHHSGGSPFEALFYADPTDSLGTGITSNWIWRVVDDDGTILTEADTGVPIGNAPRLDACLSNDGNHVFGSADGELVEDVALNTRQRFFSPLFEVETTTSATKELDLRRTVRLRYLDAE